MNDNPRVEPASAVEPSGLFKDAQNILAFLLAGFAGVLGFLGLRSEELTAVLRNNTRQATLIAFILLLSVLAAAIGVAIPSTHRVSWLTMTGAFSLLLAVSMTVIYKIPVQVTTTPENAKDSLYSSYGLAAFGVVALLVSIRRLKEPTAPIRKLKKPTIYTQFLFIMASIILLATSLYGAMRLETDSQLNSIVQISASVGKANPEATLSIHVTASKIKEVGYVGIDVMGLPSGVPIVALCSAVKIQENHASCTEDPCAYSDKCAMIFGATVPPDPNGDVNETLSDALVPRQYQDITVKASICQKTKGCRPSGSQVDLHLTDDSSPGS